MTGISYSRYSDRKTKLPRTDSHASRELPMPYRRLAFSGRIIRIKMLQKRKLDVTFTQSLAASYERS